MSGKIALHSTNNLAACVLRLINFESYGTSSVSFFWSVGQIRVQFQTFYMKQSSWVPEALIIVLTVI